LLDKSFIKAFLKTPVVILLISLILLQTFSKGLLILDYKLNKDFIYKVLCINQDRPALQCEGRCHLNKKLQKAQETESKTTHSSVSSLEIIWFYQPYASVHLRPSITSKKQIFPYQVSYQFSFLTDTFHPPQG
jgi:hypothetical protein